MIFRSTFLLLGIALATPLLVHAVEGTWTPGLQLTVEGSSALRGEAAGAESLHSLALGELAWEAPHAADSSASLRGYVSVLSLNGRGPTERYLGDFLAASNIEGHESVRLYSWWLEYTSGPWSVRAGALLADEEFGGTEAGGHFFNSAFGWPAFISANTVNTGPAFFVAAPGVRVEYRLAESAVWRVGIYDGDSFDSANGDPLPTRHGMHYHLGGDQGIFAISEIAWSNPDDTLRAKAGGWLHTADFADMRDDDFGQPYVLSGRDPATHGQNYGGYVALEKTLAGKPGEAGHAEIFARVGASPTDRNAVGWALDTGIAWTGLLPGRPADVLALGVAHAEFGSALADATHLADPTSPRLDYEQVIEVSYNLVLSERFSLQPDLQYIRHPGGSTAQRNALALLVRFNASF